MFKVKLKHRSICKCITKLFEFLISEVSHDILQNGNSYQGLDSYILGLFLHCLYCYRFLIELNKNLKVIKFFFQMFFSKCLLFYFLCVFDKRLSKILTSKLNLQIFPFWIINYKPGLIKN